MTQFLSVSPIGDTDPLDLPVANANTASRYYAETLGFRIASLDAGAATVARDAVTLRLAQNGKDPEQASCYIGVSDIEDLCREYQDRGLPVKVSEMDHEGRAYSVIWIRDPDGLCYCLGQAREAG